MVDELRVVEASPVFVATVISSSENGSCWSRSVTDRVIVVVRDLPPGVVIVRSGKSWAPPPKRGSPVVAVAVSVPSIAVCDADATAPTVTPRLLRAAGVGDRAPALALVVDALE